MVVFLSTQRVEKSLLEIYSFNLTTDIGGVLKMHSGELKMRFLPTAAIHIVWYIVNFLTFYRLVNVFSFEICSKFVFHLYESKAINTQISINILECRRLHVGIFSDILTCFFFRNLRVEMSLLDISGFNLSTDFGGVLKMHSGELKTRFMPTVPIDIA
jgi:hypothetical protein